MPVHESPATALSRLPVRECFPTHRPQNQEAPRVAFDHPNVDWTRLEQRRAERRGHDERGPNHHLHGQALCPVRNRHLSYDDQQRPCRRFHGLRRSATRTLELMMVTTDDLTCAGPYGETP